MITHYIKISVVLKYQHFFSIAKTEPSFSPSSIYKKKKKKISPKFDASAEPGPLQKIPSNTWRGFYKKKMIQ